VPERRLAARLRRPADDPGSRLLGLEHRADQQPQLGQVNDPQINAAIKAAEQTSGDAARAQAWANVDRLLVAKAVAIPWIFDRSPEIRSRDVRGISDLWNGGTWDLSYTSLTQ
jgi:ABC-type oligopeptide transport system substrate-binding subunit